MIHQEEKCSGTGFPLVVILMAIAAICGVLIMTPEHPSPARVFVPVSSSSP